MILNNWRTACEQDPSLSKLSTLSREEFNNLLPIVLDILEQRLMGQEPEADLTLVAQSHGLHRWQKAFHLVDNLRELNHLTQILYNELGMFQQLFPHTNAGLLLHVHRQIAHIMQLTVDGSVVKYDDQQRLEAAQRAAALQQALDQMEELSRQRGDMLRAASHDLRSSFGIVNSAAYLLQMEGLDEGERQQYLNMLSRNLTNVQSLLNSLMDLARLEAGEEDLRIESVNISPILHQLVDSAQPMAIERNLFLRANGPESLVIDTDTVKLQRIVQNLLLNALTYTSTGFVSVSWTKEDNARWLLGIQDSGPGLPASLAGVFGEQLRPIVETTSVTAPDEAQPVAVVPTDMPNIPPGPELDQLTQQSSHRGEGVGLQIVKRLCELLRANLEIESREGRGTLFRIRMSIHYTA